MLKVQFKIYQKFPEKDFLNTPIFGQEKELQFRMSFFYKCFINPKQGIVELKKENEFFPGFTEYIEKVTFYSMACSLIHVQQRQSWAAAPQERSELPQRHRAVPSAALSAAWELLGCAGKAFLLPLAQENLALVLCRPKQWQLCGHSQHQAVQMLLSILCPSV